MRSFHHYLTFSANFFAQPLDFWFLGTQFDIIFHSQLRSFYYYFLLEAFGF